MKQLSVVLGRRDRNKIALRLGSSSPGPFFSLVRPDAAGPPASPPEAGMREPTVAVMDLFRLATLFAVVVGAVAALPAQPLAHGGKDIAWQAWLLVDDQNQQRQEGVPVRRRIVPKSIFTAPTFSPEELPRCSEGYVPDTMQRCVKIVRVDDVAHDLFLGHKLAEQLGSIDYEEEEEVGESTAETPFQLNIPLVDYDQDNAAIILTPTGKFSPEEMELDKRKDEDIVEKDLVRLVRTTTKNYEPKTETTTNVQDETTTQTEPTTTTSPEQTTYETTTYPDPSTTILDELEEELIENKPTTEEPSTTPPPVTTYHPKFFLTTIPPTTQPNKIRFPDEAKPTKTTLYDIIKFPETLDSKPKSELRTRDLNQQINDMPKAVKWSFPEDTTTPKSYHRRNRERHNSLFLLRPKWKQEGLQKPLVLKISKKRGFIDMDQFKNVYYRALPQQDYSFLFRAHDR